ncbi:MAG: hypothetical protein ABSG56_12075 [Bryobacteraceae bacterium]|jgi:hypothetical protein
MNRHITLPLCAILLAALCCAQAPKPLLIRHPTISRDQIAFCYAGDIWTVGRQGGDAQRLTAGVGSKCDPYFSPDGKWIAYTADYYGNDDVFVIPAAGGELRRLTYHPSYDSPAGWTPDGKSILFVSGRSSSTDPPKLFTVPLEGGYPAELPLPMGSSGAFSPDGSITSLRAENPMAGRLEALPRRPDHGHLDRAPLRLARGEDSPQQLERLQSHVGGPQGLLPFRSQWSGEPVRLRYREPRVAEVVRRL